MKRIQYIMVLVALAAASVSAFGQQNLRSAYFLDGYTYNYKMNPAMAPERAFFATPGMGNVGAGVESNLALSTFLYPTGKGNLTTFMSNSVAADQFLDRLQVANNLNVSVNETLFATGYRIGKSYHTVDISLKADASAILPKDLFAFVKTGSSAGATSWDISRTGIRTNARMELAYGYSRPISDWIRVGARVKVLMGIVRADMLIDDLNLKMDGQEWAVTAHGNAQVSGPFNVAKVQGSNEVDMGNVTLPDIEAISEYLVNPSLGLAFDLGASFDFLDYFTASVSVLDLGFVGWKSTTSAVMPGGKWSFDGFDNISFDESGGIDSELDQLGESLGNMLKMEVTEEAVTKSNSLAATVHAGIEARMPFYERLSFGLLGTQRIDGIYSWTEGRVSANVAPTNWFSLAASYAVSNFGNSAGGVVNIHLPGLNLYAGLDSFLPLMNVTPQFIPIDSLNTNLTFGITFTFGKAKGRYRK